MLVLLWVALCEEGVDRNAAAPYGAASKPVALCEEGVDRNWRRPCSPCVGTVALCEEGVDRNQLAGRPEIKDFPSPSAKRAWIEMRQSWSSCCCEMVALCEEGVDRN